MDRPLSATATAETVRSQLRGLLATMRPKQWTKNIIIFAGLVFSDDRLLLQPGSFLKSLVAFMMFCLLSSAIYIMNDLADIEKDRAHPTKRDRALPSGRLSIRVAQAALLALLVVTLPGAFALSPAFGVVALAYLANNIAYNLALKNQVLLDVFSIAAGFVFRAVAGAVVIPVAISPWLYMLTLLLALFLGFSKRRHELLLLQDGRGSHRRVLDDYSPQLLEEMRNIVTASTIIAYALYTFTAPNLPKNHAMMLTIPFTLYGLFRYMYITHDDGGAPPDELLLRDKPLLITVILWGLTVVAILYFLR
ncbi:MAG: decaprenyl-phosphate phosphoribosyltransferase [Ardenticatenaceae bacterium]|nr:decaprenyl-phosphate phosphoribosyltransferase [Ardenticatenaceae bacterium]HBY93625.1 decaprenyl-phosphate phosphoribosyltransferase [Chloroflexota bacterium]